MARASGTAGAVSRVQGCPACPPALRGSCMFSPGFPGTPSQLSQAPFLRPQAGVRLT